MGPDELGDHGGLSRPIPDPVEQTRKTAGPLAPPFFVFALAKRPDQAAESLSPLAFTSLNARLYHSLPG